MWIKVTNGKVDKFPYLLHELFEDNPNVSFPAILTSEMLLNYGVVDTEDTQPPSYDPIIQSITEVTPTLQNGVWVRNWVVADLPADEAARNREAMRVTSCSAIVFKLRLTPDERIAIRTSTNPIAIDALDFINDPRLQTVQYDIAKPMLDALVAIGLLKAERIDQILV